MFKNKIILITGGTGSLGTSLTRKLLKTDAKAIRIYSRDEWKQTQMLETLDDDRLRFFIGDVRDKDRLSRAMSDVNIVYHTAALKHVPIAEYNPFEAIKTNVYGTQNVVDTCIENNIEKAIAIGTDKASLPLNAYGATKLLMEKIFSSANYTGGLRSTRFISVRYGNVLGSRGSVIPKFINQIMSTNSITVTDPKMTRFSITMNEAVDLVLRATKDGKGGEIFVPKLRSYTLNELQNAIIELIGKKVKIKKIPIRQGEKMHESLINEFELPYAYETKVDYVLQSPEIEKIMSLQISTHKKAKLKGAYTSDSVKRISKNELKKMIKLEGLLSSNL